MGMKMTPYREDEVKISDYILDKDWFSFIGNAIKECSSKEYRNLLNRYLDMGESYKIKLSYVDIEPAIDLIASSYKLNRKDEARTLTTALPISYDSRWENGLKFMDIISKRMPHLIAEFINNDKFQEKMHLIVLNNNIEVAYNKIENHTFNQFFNKIMMHLSKDQLNGVYEKNDLYISAKTTPQLRTILENFHLQNDLHINEENHNKKKNKI